MKLLFVFTGGTIGSTLSGDCISVEKGKTYRIIKLYSENFGLDVPYDIIEPYTELSENNSGNTLRLLVSNVLENQGKGYDGIIVTHGTDTIQYSAAALAYALGNSGIPVCIVSSNYPLEDKRANGLFNLHAAVKFITEQQKGGVWVAYKNPCEPVRIHRAARLLAGQAFSCRLDSIFDSYYGYYDGDFVFHRNIGFEEHPDEIPPLGIDSLADICGSILRIAPYTGIEYPKLTDSIKYVLLESYHSGTINTKSAEAERFFKEAAERRIEVFLTGASDEKAYESTKAFGKFSICPLKSCAPIAMYIKLWLADSSGIEPKQILRKSLSGDIVP